MYMLEYQVHHKDYIIAKDHGSWAALKCSRVFGFKSQDFAQMQGCCLTVCHAGRCAITDY